MLDTTYMPTIIIETSEGEVNHRIVDERFEKREIYLFGEINDDLSNAIALQLQHLEETDPKAEIMMVINSPGGSIQSGLQILDYMRMIECPIRTRCVGMAASMAAVLFACGDHREILEHAQVMIHDPLTPGISGSALQICERADDLLKKRQMFAEIFAKATGHTVEEILEKTKQDTYFEAQEAIDFGLADNIVLSKKGNPYER